MTDAEKLSKLKELLLNEDRDFAQNILSKLDQLENTVNTQSKLSEKVDPIIDYKLAVFVEEIPKTLGPTISETIAKSQDSVVEALYPVMGKMIKKFIQHEISALSENINSKVQNTFSFEFWQRKIKSAFTGVSEKEIILTEINRSSLEQVFLIEKDSGLIIASASKKESIDEDMIAGMLTAIKSFVEDAFQRDQQSLELIQYELFDIFIQNFNKYYFAVVISGGFNNSYRNQLENKVFDLASKIKVETEEKRSIQMKLKQFLNRE